MSCLHLQVCPADGSVHKGVLHADWTVILTGKDWRHYLHETYIPNIPITSCGKPFPMACPNHHTLWQVKSFSPECTMQKITMRQWFVTHKGTLRLHTQYPKLMSFLHISWHVKIMQLHSMLQHYATTIMCCTVFQLNMNGIGDISPELKQDSMVMKKEALVVLQILLILFFYRNVIEIRIT